MSSRRPLRPIFYLGPPCEVILQDEFWSELRSVGALGVCFSRLSLTDESPGASQLMPLMPERVRRLALKAVGGKAVPAVSAPAFEPDPDLYEGLPWPAPAMPARLAERSTEMKEAARRAVERGFVVQFNDDKGYFLKFPTGRINLESRHLCDPAVGRFLVARALDTTANYPSLSAISLDGVNYKWEIKPGHLDDVMAEQLDDEHSRRFAERNGIAMQRVLDGRERFRDRLQHLSNDTVEDFVRNRNGVAGALEWWLEEPDVVEWLRFKSTAVSSFLSTAYTAVKRHRPNLQFGVMWRMPAITLLSGYLPRAVQAYSDFQMPKEYWWAGGFAGQKGTVINWVDTLVEWNRGLSPGQAARWYSAAFDYPLTPGYPVERYHDEAPPAWFETAVDDQTRKMVEACGGPARTAPVVALEHTGTHLTPNELRGILRVMQAHGIERYVFATWNYVPDDCLSVIAAFAHGDA